MIQTAILAFDTTPISSIGLPADILNAAGVLWNKIAGIPVEPQFQVSVVTPGGSPVKCFHSVSITPDGALEDLASPDLIIIGALGNISDFAKKNHSTITLLRELHRQGCSLASICSGSFLLAATGLLDGKTATTHWGMTNQFRKLFPRVTLVPDRIVVDENSMLTSGGATAGADLALYLIRKYCEEETAGRTARVLLLDPYRASQSPYEIFSPPNDHGDADITHAQEWISQNYHLEITVDYMAELCSLSRRTFERRFKKATGNSPLRYLQTVRIEKAKQLLETGSHTFETITAKVGYEDTSTFRRTFQKSTGLPPSIYRQKFSRYQTPDIPASQSILPEYEKKRPSL